MQKQIPDKEVDIIELLIEIWSKKLKILLITLICVIFGAAVHFLKDDENKTIFKINSEVYPISLVEDTKYSKLNSYVYNYHSKKNNLLLNLIDETKPSELANLKSGVNLNPERLSLNVDKKLLFQLFLKKMSSQKKLENYLDKFKLYKKNDYKNDGLLIKSFSEILTSVKNINVKNLKPLTIKIQTQYYNQTLEFLEFINKEINIEVKDEINEIFESHIETKKLLKKFKLDDIDQSLEIFNNSAYTKYLIKEKQLLLNDKYIDRLKIIYSDLPISDSEKFYAAKIVYQSSSSKNLSRSYRKNIIVSGLLGILISIIIVLTSRAIRMREVK